MEKCLLFEKLEASLAYCSVSYDDQLPHIQVFVGFTVCHFLCKNNIGNIGKGKQECFGTTKKDRTVWQPWIVRLGGGSAGYQLPPNVSTINSWVLSICSDLTYFTLEWITIFWWCFVSKYFSNYFFILVYCSIYLKTEMQWLKAFTIQR